MRNRGQDVDDRIWNDITSVIDKNYPAYRYDLDRWARHKTPDDDAETMFYLSPLARQYLRSRAK